MPFSDPSSCRQSIPAGLLPLNTDQALAAVAPLGLRMSAVAALLDISLSVMNMNPMRSWEGTLYPDCNATDHRIVHVDR
jgi:hypothetical protein